MIFYSKVALHSVEEETIKHPEALRYDISKVRRLLKMLKFAWLEKRFNCRTNPELWVGGVTEAALRRYAVIGAKNAEWRSGRRPISCRMLSKQTFEP